MLQWHGQTDVGRRRVLNEDAILVRAPLFLVCDGIGGHKAGEVASSVTVDTIASFVARSGEDPEMTWPYGYDTTLSWDANRLVTAIKLANRAVFRKASSTDEYTGMGTTVAAVLVHPSRPQMSYAHVGDSRVYLLRAGVMQQLTRDDTWANLDWPDDTAASAPMRNVLTKALGVRDDVDVTVSHAALQDGDIVLICSDGLTNMLTDAEIVGVLSAKSGDLAAACEELVSRANAAGGRDNISVVLARYGASA